jgi:hypothetical protein
VVRTLLSAVLALLLPARGHRRGTPAPAPAPAPVRPFTPRVAASTPAPLDGGEIALIRPYCQRWADAGPEEREAILCRTRCLDAAEVLSA